MTIKTITCHNVYNHGASLQAYALMKYLSDHDFKTEIINYLPNYLRNKYNLFAINNSKWKRNFLYKIFYIIAKLPIRLINLRRKFQFDKFTKKFLSITKTKYYSNNDLITNPPIADVYICGSDQIWNTFFYNGRDPAFYLDFVPKGKIKISYAPSFAINEISNDYKLLLAKRIKEIDFISIREKSGLDILKEMGIYNATIVSDPVFLINMEEWINFTKQVKYKKYILVYDFDNSILIKNIAIKIAKDRGLKIITINDIKLNYSHKNLWYIDPQMFVSLVKCADFIVSNSYHATVFSIIFRKEFAVVKRKEDINTRMIDLLETLDISNRIINDENEIYKLLNKIEYNRVNSKLESLIKESKEFLSNALNSKIGD